MLLFSAGRPDALAPLEPGIRELGDLVLPAAAAISGRVLSSEGRPLAQVLLSSSGQGWDTLGQSATSDAEGRFVLGGIQASRAGVSASALEHQSAFAGPFDLTPGQIHGPIEIRLEPGGRLEGRVVGAQGEPLAGVRIDLLPNGGRIVTTESDAQGRFEAVLQTPGAHRLLARREGYRARDIGEGLLEVEAGTPVELVLEPEAVTEFLVQDALTGAAIERFTLTVQPGRSGYFAAGPAPGSPAPEPGFHAQGRLRTAAGEQDRVRVQAPGYAALQARVVWDAPGQATCTLRLEPAARLSGRIQSAGSGVADVRLILAQSRSQTNLEARTGPEGGFEFAELAPGSYTLEAHASTGVLRRADIRLQAAERRDLGPLELAASGSLRVRLRPPPGQSAAGLGLRLEDSLQSPLASSDGDGLARFEGLPPGPARVRFEGAAQRFAASSWMPVEIEPGRETQLEIDLAPLAACRIEVELVAPKLGGAAVRLSLAAPKELRDEGIPWLVHPSLVDAEGRWVGFAFPAGQASIDAWVDSLPDWNWTGPEVRPSPGGLIQERLELPAAELLLDWQEAQDWPLDLRLELALSALEAPAEAGSAARRELSATLPFDRRTPGALQGSAAELLAPGRLRWSALPPGRWRVGLRLCSASGETLLRSASADLDLPANGNAELSLR